MQHYYIHVHVAHVMSCATPQVLLMDDLCQCQWHASQTNSVIQIHGNDNSNNNSNNNVELSMVVMISCTLKYNAACHHYDVTGLMSST